MMELDRLTEIVLEWSNAKSPLLIGLAGLPGSGKTTLGLRLAEHLTEKKTLAISLDDFYLSPAEREAKGLRWRAVPGSHDLLLLAQFLKELKSDAETIVVPQYDRNAEVRFAPVVQPKPDVVIFDGWLIGARACGYEELEDAFDRLIFIDMDLEVAHQSRLNREAKIREASNGKLGMSAADTESFWTEALLPTGILCATKLRDTADAIVSIDEHYQLKSLTLKNSASSASLW